jgi:cell division protein FtsB
MENLFTSIGVFFQKYGLFPAVAILSLILGGYGCYQASLNQKDIQAQEVAIARLDARQEASNKEITERMSGVEKNLVELTTQIKLLVEGKINISSGDKK